jgi:hypothetical protein
MEVACEEFEFEMLSPDTHSIGGYGLSCFVP